MKKSARVLGERIGWKGILCMISKEFGGNEQKG